MARATRIDVAGTLHHVMVRGWNRGTLFYDDDDRKAFLERLEETLAWGDGACFAWALMDNHVHLVLQRGRQPLSRVMHRVNSWYASYLNRKLGRRSAALDGRYKVSARRTPSG